MLSRAASCLPRPVPTFAALALLFVAPTLAHAQIYRWEDKNGAVHFAQDRDEIPEPFRESAARVEGTKSFESEPPPDPRTGKPPPTPPIPPGLTLPSLPGYNFPGTTSPGMTNPSGAGNGTPSPALDPAQLRDMLEGSLNRAITAPNGGTPPAPGSPAFGAPVNPNRPPVGPPPENDPLADSPSANPNQNPFAVEPPDGSPPSTHAPHLAAPASPPTFAQEPETEPIAPLALRYTHVATGFSFRPPAGFRESDAPQSGIAAYFTHPRHRVALSLVVQETAAGEDNRALLDQLMRAAIAHYADELGFSLIRQEPAADTAGIVKGAIAFAAGNASGGFDLLQAYHLSGSRLFILQLQAPQGSMTEAEKLFRLTRDSVEYAPRASDTVARLKPARAAIIAGVLGVLGLLALLAVRTIREG